MLSRTGLALGVVMNGFINDVGWVEGLVPSILSSIAFGNVVRLKRSEVNLPSQQVDAREGSFRTRKHLQCSSILSRGRISGAIQYSMYANTNQHLGRIVQADFPSRLLELNSNYFGLGAGSA